MESPAPSGNSGSPSVQAGARVTVLTFVVLTFAFSSVFWYLTAITPPVPENRNLLLVCTIGVMWCPALAAVITRLWFQRNLKGFGIRPGKPVWILTGVLLPVAAGLIMFGLAWISNIAPFNSENAAIVFSLAFIPASLYAIAFNLFAAAGEEFGWRGFLVPELGRFSGFTTLALISAAIWTAWHIPLILFGSYHGTGPAWYSLAVFIPSVMGAGIILAWLRLASGSVWVAILFHGFWNYFIQVFYPSLTVTTPAGSMMLGEFGWFVAIFYVLLALIFWHFRDRLPKLPAEGL
ncbi:CPBP family intramembrane glutamic endopeptidase [Methanoregula formicica]|uniref:CAAX amino terminal protease family n=1 Tax=Methanoregula formicica (strain DSM 22288 / NBRC 105244 / SMSP) TaxID=593750 RepID=L0HFM1_METFS|nr:type II CAAX endopeptidase family protein [Methanoregula formicica]AGB02591.1 CAAX amino terminal protease family [Methanoregula formicica SMSP]